MELGIVKQKADVDNEQILAYKDQIAALQNQSKVYADRVILLSSVIKLAETLAVTSSDQAATTRKEADIAGLCYGHTGKSQGERDAGLTFYSGNYKTLKCKYPQKKRSLQRI